MSKNKTDTVRNSTVPHNVSLRSAALPAAALLLIGLNLRPAIVALAPLLDEVRRDTGMSNAGIGVLSTAPVVCFGIFAPMAPRLASRFGIERTLMGVLVLLVAGVLVRLATPVGFLFGGSIIIGAAVAVANVLVTAMIKRDFERWVGPLSGLHTTMLFGGAVLAAGLTEPIRQAAHLTWREGLAIWGVLALVAIPAWIPSVKRRHRGPATGGVSARGIWLSPLAWAVALFYAFQQLVWYTTTTWIPSFYISLGYSSSTAGWFLAIVCFCAIATAVATPFVAQRSHKQGHLVVVGAVSCAIALLGIVMKPTAAPAFWSALLGLGFGVVVSLGIMFMSTRASHHSSAAQLSAMSQAVGYLVAAAGPVALGVARDATGNWTLGWLIVLGAVVPMTIAGWLSGRGTIP
ncbi:MFS transporter (plasmid) [Mycolicibacterium arabiense]|uniref:MFS transporter n=1 Tax=Mycolicibacterium arabiense TaxID=1286181 RepID=A0A7I7RRL5_9MYCO|nr:MFS transporter [Mycolicibacterium arabiense]MCV7371983.1 MFS transporter [Mycolicibacterium arabiense]BBY46696.1 MFS transporter [Mycolicibacterium arabiense]